MKKPIFRELGIFLAVGLTAVAIDFASYKGLVLATGLFAASKTASFVIGAVFAFFANRALTFGHVQRRPDSWYRFIALYLVALGANVAVNALCLSLFASFDWRVRAAFCIATGLSAAINFVGMKLFVFTHQPQAAP